MESLLTAKLVDDLTHTPSNKSRKAPGWYRHILAGCYGGIAGCAMIGQTIVNVKWPGPQPPLNGIAGLVLLLLVTALSRDGEDPDGGSGRVR